MNITVKKEFFNNERSFDEQNSLASNINVINENEIIEDLDFPIPCQHVSHEQYHVINEIAFCLIQLEMPCGFNTKIVAICESGLELIYSMPYGICQSEKCGRIHFQHEVNIIILGPVNEKWR